MTEPPVKILFIMGWGRSGSTLLDNVLGEIEGFTSLGELHYLWRRGFIKQHTCGCRRPVGECELWSKVLDTPFRDRKLGELDPAEVDRWQHDSVRMRYFRRLLRFEPGAPTNWKDLDNYIEALAAVYRAVARVDGSRVVVDSSKRPSDGAVVRLLPGIDPFYVHLVRDPRATAHSWRRVKMGPHRRLRHLGPAVYSTTRWLNRNAAAERLKARAGEARSMFLRYEDFVARPRATVREVVRFVGEHAGEPPFVDDRTVELGVNHTVSGNQRRFQTGPIEVRRDDAWMTDQPPFDRLLTTALALPKLRRYGYNVRGEVDDTSSTQQAVDPVSR